MNDLQDRKLLEQLLDQGYINNLKLDQLTDYQFISDMGSLYLQAIPVGSTIEVRFNYIPADWINSPTVVVGIGNMLYNLDMWKDMT